MRIPFLLLLVFFSAVSGHAQEVICSLNDKKDFKDKIEASAPAYSLPYGDAVTYIGKTFMGIPYVAKTLEIGKTESLVVNLHGLDCTTFVENVLTFTRMTKQKKSDLDTYLQLLEHIRYIDGKLDGYVSRLHYYSQWLRNNEEKGILKDITASIGGVHIEKEINFMSTHRSLYPFLKDDGNYEKIKEVENELNSEPLCYLPQQNIAKQEHLIQSGDIIALATSIKGLDITHTGIATKEKDGRVHLLHASSKGMEVEITKEPLADYLKKIKNNTGIMVYRPVAVK